MKHTVKSGETLGSIAVKYGMRQKDLAVANNITDPLKLPVGKELVIPGWDAASGKPSGKSSSKSGSAAPKTEAPPDAAPVLQPAPVLAPQPAPASDVPVIRVDEAPRKP